MRASPARGKRSGSTLTASVRWPVGASQSSHARPSTIRASVAPSASARVVRSTAAWSIAAYDASNAFFAGAVTEPRITSPRWIAAVRTWPWLTTLATLARRFRDDRLALVAGSLTFTTIISLVPVVAVMLALFSIFPMFATLQGALQQYFLQTLVPE